MSVVVDNVYMTYSSFEELMERQIFMEDRISRYLKTMPIADSFNSTVRISPNNKYILQIELVKN